MSIHIRALVTRPLSHSKVTCDTNFVYERDLSSLVISDYKYDISDRHYDSASV